MARDHSAPSPLQWPEANRESEAAKTSRQRLVLQGLRPSPRGARDPAPEQAPEPARRLPRVAARMRGPSPAGRGRGKRAGFERARREGRAAWPGDRYCASARCCCARTSRAALTRALSPRRYRPLPFLHQAPRAGNGRGGFASFLAPFSGDLHTASSHPLSQASQLSPAQGILSWLWQQWGSFLWCQQPLLLHSASSPNWDCWAWGKAWGLFPSISLMENGVEEALAHSFPRSGLHLFPACVPVEGHSPMHAHSQQGWGAACHHWKSYSCWRHFCLWSTGVKA